MTLSVDVYWSFRSPYSYLATGRLVRFQAHYDLEINVKPVLPLAVRSPEFFQRVPGRALLRPGPTGSAALAPDPARPRAPFRPGALSNRASP